MTCNSVIRCRYLSLPLNNDNRRGLRIVLRIVFTFACFVVLSRRDNDFFRGFEVNFINSKSARVQQPSVHVPKCRIKKEDEDLKHLCNMKNHSETSLCPRERTNSLSTTLVTQTTLDRLQLLLQICERWKSPIITVVYVTRDERENMWAEVSDRYNNQCPHLQMIPYVAKSELQRSHAYPINTMRNIALDHVQTSHVLLIDADFIPSDGLDVAVLKAIKLVEKKSKSSTSTSANDNLHALVVPAYERQMKTSLCTSFEECYDVTKKDPEFMPRTIFSLKKCVNDKKCIVFHSDYYKEGHGNTQSEKWLRNMDNSKIRTIPCMADGYEPYVVIPWCPNRQNNKHSPKKTGSCKPTSPYFDERFYGYGMNKIQQIAHLQQRGYRFAVIPATGFLTHHPHPESITKLNWRGREGETMQTDNMKQHMFDLFDQYKEDLKHVYSKSKVRTKQCPVASWSFRPSYIFIMLVAFIVIKGKIHILWQWYQKQIRKDDRQKR